MKYCIVRLVLTGTQQKMEAKMYVQLYILCDLLTPGFRTMNRTSWPVTADDNDLCRHHRERSLTWSFGLLSQRPVRRLEPWQSLSTIGWSDLAL